MNLNTRLIDITLGDFLEFLDKRNNQHAHVVEKPKNYVHGISGIANLLGVSKTTVWKYRDKGWIEPAIKQDGRTIVCDADLALELFGNRNN